MKEIVNIPSAIQALQAIANMEVQEHTDTAQALALCLAIARIELKKWAMAQEDSE